jgi:hypothetical protein
MTALDRFPCQHSSMSKNVMRLLDRCLGLMECKVCGRRHFAGLIEGNQFVRDAEMLERLRAEGQ